jgi:hypothetical protein
MKLSNKLVKSWIEELEQIIEEKEKLCQRAEDLRNRMAVTYERRKRARSK